MVEAARIALASSDRAREPSTCVAPSSRLAPKAPMEQDPSGPVPVNLRSAEQGPPRLPYPAGNAWSQPAGWSDTRRRVLGGDYDTAVDLREKTFDSARHDVVVGTCVDARCL